MPPSRSTSGPNRATLAGRRPERATPPATAETANPPTLAPPIPVRGAPTLPAITDTTNPAALDYVIQYPMFGDLAFRKDLADKGIDLIAHYISETMSNTRGIGGTGTAYAQQVDVGASFDLDKLGVWSDAVARFAMTDRAGRSLAADRTGSYFAYQEIFGQGQNLRFNEITVEKFLLEKELALKVGFYPMGNDFSTLPYVCNFTNVAFCGHPQSEPVNSGWSDAPAGRWGGRVKYHITDELQIQGGVYDVNPLVTLRQDGFKLNFSGNKGVIAPIEIGYQLGKNPEDYGGTYKIGAYYDTSAAPDLANPAVFDQGRQGLYLEAAQQIYKWGPDAQRAGAVRHLYRQRPEHRQIQTLLRGGRGFPGRVSGPRVGHFEPRLGQDRHQSAVSISAGDGGIAGPDQRAAYRTHLHHPGTPSLQFRPGVQYDIRPGATSTHPNTWVFGFQVKLTL